LVFAGEAGPGSLGPEEIQVGLALLARSAHGECLLPISREGGSRRRHCPPLRSERGVDKVVEFYSLLDGARNRQCITESSGAVAEWKARAGLRFLDYFEPPTCRSLPTYVSVCRFASALRKCELANRYRKAAWKAAPYFGSETAVAASTPDPQATIPR